MDRDYADGFSSGNDVKIFVGKEIEHTPAFGKTTLFLATNQLTTDQILQLARDNNCEAVYYGANRMYQHNLDQIFQMEKLIDAGLYVTVDYPYALHTAVKEKFKKIWTNAKFIPFCSIVFENVEDDSNLSFKIDDVDFNATNSAVWSSTMSKYMLLAGTTKWEEYKQDKILESSQLIPENKEKIDA